MNAFRDYVSKQLHAKLLVRRVVVWYDPDNAFAPFLEELEVLPDEGDRVRARLGDITCALIRSRHSLFGVRSAAEPLVSGDRPRSTLLYLGGHRREKLTSVLMELELAGECYEPQLKRLARNALRTRYSDGEIDELLAPPEIRYSDIVAFLQQREDEGKTSVLKLIFSGISDPQALLAAWLATTDRDKELAAKGGADEIRKLMASRLGLDVPTGFSLGDLRDRVFRYILGNEFRSDLAAPAPASLALIPQPTSRDHQEKVSDVARRLRQTYPEAYMGAADRVNLFDQQHLANLIASVAADFVIIDSGGYSAVVVIRSVPYKAMLTLSQMTLVQSFHELALEVVDAELQGGAGFLNAKLNSGLRIEGVGIILL